jgi:hypothetical protein
MEGFKKLNAEELDTLLAAPILITILVGAADGELDREERSWSERLMRTRAYNKPKHLNEFYRVVSEGFLDKIDAQMAALPTNTEARNAVLTEKLKEVNPVMAKLDVQLGADLYHGFLGLANETAESSGGILRIGAISREEAKWLKLPMLTPVIAPAGHRTDSDGVDEDERDPWEG